MIEVYSFGGFRIITPSSEEQKMNRIMLKEKGKKIVDLGNKLGAQYIEDNELIFYSDAHKWVASADGSVSDKYKCGIRFRPGEGVDIGQIRKSCMNYETETCFWYKKSDITWIIKTLNTINGKQPKFKIPHPRN